MLRQTRLVPRGSATDVAIVGAGPYGLGLAAHLASRGIDHRIFGPPMQVWKDMSPGMYLKSFGFATSIDVRADGASLPQYCRRVGVEDYEPIPIATFAEYGTWIQHQHVPHLESTMVIGLSRCGAGFRLELETGEAVVAARVVVAIGLTYFEHVPEVLAELPAEVVTHSAEDGDFSKYAGRDVVVIGAGQSALQAAALLHEHGARARLLVRNQVKWNWATPRDQHRSALERMRLPQSTLGPGRDNWVLEHLPSLVHYLPAQRRLNLTERYLGPSGAWWLRDRVDGLVPIRENTRVAQARWTGARARLRLEDAAGGLDCLETDHVIAATGYRVDTAKIAFLDPGLARCVRAYPSGAPVLSRHFESSMRGLYFVGPASAASFGPLFRFVAGSKYTVGHLARHLAWSSAESATRWQRTLAYV